MRPVALVIFVCILLYALVLFLVSTHGALPAGMHLATEVRIDTLWKPGETMTTRSLGSLDSLIESRKK
jgi:hypothetical protein